MKLKIKQTFPVVSGIGDIFSNKTLEVLDISGNQSGDSLAVALAKMLQHNRTIHTLFWDCNEISVTGLKSILLGLQRNHSIKHMPLPLLDLASILKKENVDTEAVEELTKKIQREVYEKAQLEKVVSTSDLTESVNITSSTTARLSNIKTISAALPEDGLQPLERIPTGKGATTKTSPTERRRSTHQRIHTKRKRHQPSVDIIRAAMVFGGGLTEDEQNSESVLGDEEPNSTEIEEKKKKYPNMITKTEQNHPPRLPPQLLQLLQEL